jgi:hypothetical protein
MTHPPRRSAADLTVSIVVLIVTVLGVAVSALIGLMATLSLSSCQPPGCHADAAVVLVLGAMALAGVVGAVGAVLTVVRLVQRKTAWPFAVGTFGGCLGAVALGVIAYLVTTGA